MSAVESWFAPAAIAEPLVDELPADPAHLWRTMST